MALAAALGTGAATAQAQNAPSKDTSKAASASAQASQTMADVSKWTRGQWHAAKVKWQEEKDSWNSCQNEAKTQNLSGRKSWQFLYDCMTKS
jgi:Rieske Fe-S protein